MEILKIDIHYNRIELYYLIGNCQVIEDVKNGK